MGRTVTFLVVCVLLLSACPSARAQTQLDVSYGWGERYRLGKWTPVFATLSDPRPRNAVIELVAPGTSGGASMRIRQVVAIGPEPATYPLLAPLSYNLEQTVLTVRDLDSKRRIAEFIFNDPDNPKWQQSYQFTSPETPLIGVSGRGATMQLLERQLAAENSTVSVGYLEPRFVPSVAEGFSSLDALVLNQPNLDPSGGSREGLRLEQQQAIVNWVRAGGNLILWPSEDPIPPTSPIVAVMPASVGDLAPLGASPEDLAAVGLPARFAQMRNRPLTPVANAETFRLLGENISAIGCQRRLGFGKIIVLSIDASALQFNDVRQTKQFWDPILARVTPPPPDPASTTQPYYQQDTSEQRRGNAVMSIMDLLGDVPGVGSFGFSYVAIVLIALMLVVGPVDWFILKKLGRQPWTWVTTAGWITLVTVGAIYIGHVFRSGELHLRTLRFIDQADGQSVATIDMVGIYSPQTTWYELNVEPDGWYRPPELGRYYYGGRAMFDVPFHQDYQGNHPDPMLINVWNLRFVEGESIKPGAPMIDAKLHVAAGGTLAGSITNLSDKPLENISVLVGDRQIKLPGNIRPGETTNVNAALAEADREFRPTASDPDEGHYYYGAYYGQSGSQFQYRTTELLAAYRTREVERLRSVAEPAFAIVYAQVTDPAPAANLVDQPEARQKHWQVVRALVELEQTP